MKKALVHLKENLNNLDGSKGFRICQISDTEFEVHSDFEWHDVADNVVADQWYWDGTQALEVPIPPPKMQPKTTGTVEL